MLYSLFYFSQICFKSFSKAGCLEIIENCGVPFDLKPIANSLLDGLERKEYDILGAFFIFVLHLKSNAMCIMFGLQASPTLQNVTVEAKKGDLLMLIGPVGCGKVITCKLIRMMFLAYLEINISTKTHLSKLSSTIFCYC